MMSNYSNCLCDLLVGDGLGETSCGCPREIDSLVHQAKGVAKSWGVEDDPGGGDPKTNHNVNQSILKLYILLLNAHPSAQNIIKFQFVKTNIFNVDVIQSKFEFNNSEF